MKTQMTMKFNDIKLERMPYWNLNMQESIHLFLEKHPSLQQFYMEKTLPFLNELVELSITNNYKPLHKDTENCLYFNETEKHYFSPADWTKICHSYLNYNFAAQFVEKNNLHTEDLTRTINYQEHVETEGKKRDKVTMRLEIEKAVEFLKILSITNVLKKVLAQMQN